MSVTGLRFSVTHVEAPWSTLSEPPTTTPATAATTATTDPAPLLPTLKAQLEQTKRDIEGFTLNDPERLKFYTWATALLDPFRSLKKHVHLPSVPPRGITNAFLKCWEMLHTFDLIPAKSTSSSSSSTSSSSKFKVPAAAKTPSTTLRVFCNAEFPGAFVLALRHFVQTCRPNLQLDWYANSLWPGAAGHDEKQPSEAVDEGALGDLFGLYRDHPDRWLMDAHHSGDVTHPDTWARVGDRLAGSIDLYTSDIGVGCWDNQEEAECRLNLGQVLCGLLCLRAGGNMVFKQFMLFTPLHYSLLHLLTPLFRNLFVCKPLSSRAANSEIYVVGLGFVGGKDAGATAAVESIRALLTNWDDERAPMTLLTPVPDAARRRLERIAETLAVRQMWHIQRNIAFVQSAFDLALPLPLTQRTCLEHEQTKDAIEWTEYVKREWCRQFKLDTTA